MLLWNAEDTKEGTRETEPATCHQPGSDPFVPYVAGVSGKVMPPVPMSIVAGVRSAQPASRMTAAAAGMFLVYRGLGNLRQRSLVNTCQGEV